MKRKYLMQGDLDGACFLYSIANSVVALTSKQPNVNQWANALPYIPFAHDFISGNVGTKNYDDHSEIYKFAVQQAISEFSPKKRYDIAVHPNTSCINQIASLISASSVVVLNLSGDHWICVVDVNEEKNALLSACSDLGDRVNCYTEIGCRFGRVYNYEYVLSKDGYKIHKTSVIQIKLNA